MAKNEKMELAVVSFNPPGLNPENYQALQEALHDEGLTIADLKPDFIKMPSGGILSYVFPDKANGKQDLRDEFKAVVLFSHECNAYWPSKDTDNSPPTCQSMDGKTGYGDTYDGKGAIKRNCVSCPMNQYGTATDANGQQGKGKACKNMRRLFVMCEDENNITPKVLTLPPSSLGCYAADWRAKNIVMAGLRSYSTLIRFEMDSKELGGKKVGVATCSVAGQVSPEVAAKLKSMQESLKAQFAGVALNDGMATEPADLDDVM